MAEPRTLGSDTVFRGRRTSVRWDRIQMAEGHVVEREVVVSHDSVAMVAIDEERNVLLVRQFRAPPGVVLLEVPAGTIESGEEPLSCAHRELREETGFTASRLAPIGDFWTTPGFSTERMYVFLATGLRPDALPSDDDEDIQLERVPFSQALEMARSGQVHDAKTIAALIMAEHLLAR